MSSSDSSIVFSQIDEAVTLTDNGSNSLVISVAKGTLTWSRAAKPVTEMMIRNKHTPTLPTLRVTGDTKITGSIELHGCSFKGNAAKTPYEVMTGNASWVNTASGDVQTLAMVAAYDASAAKVGGGGTTGASQTLTFGFVHFDKVDVSFADGILSIKADFTDYENDPTIA